MVSRFRIRVLDWFNCRQLIRFRYDQWIYCSTQCIIQYDSNNINLANERTVWNLLYFIQIRLLYGLYGLWHVRAEIGIWLEQKTIRVVVLIKHWYRTYQYYFSPVHSCPKTPPPTPSKQRTKRSSSVHNRDTVCHLCHLTHSMNRSTSKPEASILKN